MIMRSTVATSLKRNIWSCAIVSACSSACMAIICAVVMLTTSQTVSAAPGLDSPVAIAPYLDGIFPSTTPGSAEGGEWVQVDYYPDLTFVEPIRIIEHPVEDRLLIVGKDGIGWTVSHQQGATDQQLFFDITPIMHGKSGVGEGGISDMVFHPEFGQAQSPNSNYVYFTYRWSPTRSGTFNDNPTIDGYNRLSRFSVINGQVDLSTEQILINQYDRQQWHIGGDMFFGADGFLYISTGDEGNCCDRNFNTQRLDGGLWSGILRIDVDMDPTRSHPIRRQPTHLEEDPRSNGPEWPASFTQNYFIPNDNPFLSPNGSQLEEFYSIGLRHPFTISRDDTTGNIWIADVGQAAMEEINISRSGDNHQWGYREGTVDGVIDRPDNVIGNEAPPLWAYGRDLGRAVIGAGVYRGNKYPELFGRYLFSDFLSGNLWTSTTNGDVEQIGTVTAGFPNGINGYLLDSKGDILMARTAGGLNPNGKIEMLTRAGNAVASPEPPQALSQTGAFTDLENLVPNAGCIPYDLNVPFWSDAALKDRWMCVPNNGTHNTDDERIGFSANGDWSFPVGTVLMKHFELLTDTSDPTSNIRLETRFIVHGEDGYYGVTYRWNDAGTDAFLLTTGEDETYTVDGAPQTWRYPSRTECQECHTEVAGGALGPITRQLNGDTFYPITGRTENQLETLNSLGLFNPAINQAELAGFLDTVLTSSPTEDESLSVAARARSYLDSNCSYCHQPDGVRANFDARLTTPLTLQNLINGELVESQGIEGEAVIVPGDLSRSIAFHRMSIVGDNAMPPIAKDVVDPAGVDILSRWILSLESFEVGNDTSTGGNFIDGHHPSLYINEQDTFVQDNEPGTLYVNEFKFFAQRSGNPVTPVVVRVNSDNNFTVLAVGTTRTQNEYSVGQNTFAFSDNGTVALNLSAGDVIATGFMDSFPDGTGWGAGTVIPAEAGSGANQDEIWALLPVPLITQNNDFDPDVDAPLVVVNQNIATTNTGRDNGARTNLRRSYKFAMTFALTDNSDNTPGNPVINDSLINGSFESPVVGTFETFSQANAIPGWTITSGEVEIDRTPWPASEGSQSMDLSGNFAGSLEQTVSGFIAGASYELRFEYALHATASSSRSANVLIDNNVVSNITATTGMLAPNYQTAGIPFIADSSQKTFGFNSLSPDSRGVVIDNVRVILTGTSEPEPEPEPQPQPQPQPQPIGENLALNQPATQSSTAFSGVASRAVDGNINGSYNGNSVTHTNGNSNNPWWRVDLGNSFDINTINIFNRTNNCCTSRLDGAQVYIGNVNSTNPADYTQVGTLSGSTAVQTVSGSNTAGRYVMIRINGTGTLSLAEVQVFGETASEPEPEPQPQPEPEPEPSGENLALNQPATQSTTDFNGAASRAVDGNTNGHYQNGQSTTHTNVNSLNPWWRVDLGEIFDVQQINIYNRTNCCNERLNGAQVYIGTIDSTNPADYTEVGTLTGTTSAQTVSGNNTSGRYVMVRINGTGTLSLAEVQVFGETASEPEPPVVIENLALNQPTTQSSTGFSGVASRAVDGNTNGNYNQNSVTHTNPNTTNPWWRVDLGANSNIESISVYNRTDNCCTSRLDGAQVYLGNINSTNPADYTEIGTLTGSTSVQTLSSGNAPGRYVMIRINGPGILSLAEVEVMGAAISLGRSSTVVTTSSSASTSAAQSGGGSFDSTIFWLLGIHSLLLIGLRKRQIKTIK